jgi:putative hydrolase of HD superfamily
MPVIRYKFDAIFSTLKLLLWYRIPQFRGNPMKNLIDLLFQAHHLKNMDRTGYAFLGPGKESVAEHSFSAAFVGLILSHLEPNADALRLITMCLLHDLAEARTGDLNYVQKKYVDSHEDKAVTDTVKNLSFGADWTEIISEFNQGNTIEAQLAHDADQISFLLELKSLADMGYAPPLGWLDSVTKRLKTTIGQQLAHEIRDTPSDRWWRKLFH